MKTLIVLFMMTASFAAQAAVNSLNQARSVKDEVLSQLTGVTGVNGVGIGACDAQTGKILSPVNTPNFEYCVVINVVDDQTLATLQSALPARVDGILVKAKLVGEIHKDPRMSGGT